MSGQSKRNPNGLPCRDCGLPQAGSLAEAKCEDEHTTLSDEAKSGSGTTHNSQLTTSDFFQRLGLPRRFSVDAGELERAYIAQSREVHPDYHMDGSAAQLEASLEASAALNEAYNTLRDPFTRAEYLLRLEGGPSASEQRQMPGTFLAEMLEAREQVEQARGKAADAGRLDAEFTKRFDALIERVAEIFASLEQRSNNASRASALSEIRTLLNAAKYMRGLLRDLRAD
jgi:molecular chaperone HscB